MTDKSIYIKQKKQLIKSLIAKGISDKLVLQAINKVPREEFVSDEFKASSYEDRALPIDCMQTISQPYTVAYMTQLLKLKFNDKVLEIGTGSGYQTAILANIVTKIYTVERISELYEQAKYRLSYLSDTISFKLDDGTVGWKENAPYDKIIVTAAAPEIPIELLDQMSDNSRLIIPVGSRDSQQMVVAQKINGKYFQNTLDSFKFVPLIGKYGWDD